MGIWSTEAIKRIPKPYKTEKGFSGRQGWAVRGAQDVVILQESSGNLRAH